jgi:hypothetical protein
MKLGPITYPSQERSQDAELFDVRASVYQTFSNLIVSVSGSWIEIHSSAAQVCVTPCKHAVTELPHTADYVFGPGGGVAEKNYGFLCTSWKQNSRSQYFLVQFFTTCVAAFIILEETPNVPNLTGYIVHVHSSWKYLG